VLTDTDNRGLQYSPFKAYRYVSSTWFPGSI
jgi:hypothetical protein